MSTPAEAAVPVNERATTSPVPVALREAERSRTRVRRVPEGTSLLAALCVIGCDPAGDRGDREGDQRRLAGDR